MASPATQFRDERRSCRKAVAEAGMITVEMNPIGFGLMLNVSRAGMAVYTLNRIKPGQDVQVSFALPKSAIKVEGIAKVTWASNGNAGLHMYKIKRAGLEAMDAWLATLPDAPSPSNGIAQRGRRPLFDSHIRAIEADIRVAGLGADDALQLIADRMLALMKASGAAIAVGPPEQMVCRGSAGLAPDIGVAISADSGLTGECLRTAQLIRCDDTESDSRVDREACRQLNLRSSLIAPVLFDGHVKGVLEVFSPREKGFSEEHVLLLEGLADLSSQLVYGRPPQPELPPLIAPEPEVAVSMQSATASIEHRTEAPVAEPDITHSDDFDDNASPNLRRPWLVWVGVLVLLLSLFLCWLFVSSSSAAQSPQKQGCSDGSSSSRRV